MKRYSSKWSRPFVLSLLFHSLAVAMATLVFSLWPAATPVEEFMEVDLVAAHDQGQQSNGPAIHAPANPSTVAEPAPNSETAATPESHGGSTGETGSQGGPGRSEMGGNSSAHTGRIAPQLLSRPSIVRPPQYKKGLHVEAVVHVIVEADGSVSAISMSSSSGYADIDDAIMQSMASAQFVPGQKNGVPIRSGVSQTVTADF